MLTRIILFGALLVASLAYFFSNKEEAPQRPPYIQGRNKTVLFLANQEHGLANAHLATVSALLENHPDIEVHYGSFPRVGKKLERISSFARKKTPAAKDVKFHALKGPSFEDAIKSQGKALSNVIHPPASAGISHLVKDMQLWLSPWTADDHFQLYTDMDQLIDEVDPAVIVLDTLFRPAIDITRDKNRQHIMLTPNTLVDNFLGDQPHGSVFWKYPAMASGFPFPVPLRNIPENIWLNLRFIYAVVMTPDLNAKKAVLKEKGLKDPINWFGLHRNDVPWISMTTWGATIPVDVIPPNVTCAGPMILSAAPAAKQDAEFAAWMKKAPTVLINLGSNVHYNHEQAIAMVGAIVEVLSKSNVQIVWKFNKDGDYSEELLAPLQPFSDNGRLRMSKWLTVDPVSMLETGDVIASVHHGGSNCFHEAVATGVAQVVLPLWADLYNFAALAETIGVGVWGCRATSPSWTAECLGSSILEVVNESNSAMRKEAKRLGKEVQARGHGRDVAAGVVADIAYIK